MSSGQRFAGDRADSIIVPDSNAFRGIIAAPFARDRLLFHAPRVF